MQSSVVSVIMPAYNGEQFFTAGHRECIGSNLCFVGVDSGGRWFNR